MQVDQTNPPVGVEPLLVLDGSGPLRDQLARAVRAAVRDGRLRAGAALPPSRALAEDLGVSRWVVTEAYGELVAEGVLDARTGSATRVGQGAWPVGRGGRTASVTPGAGDPPAPRDGTTGRSRRTTPHLSALGPGESSGSSSAWDLAGSSARSSVLGPGGSSAPSSALGRGESTSPSGEPAVEGAQAPSDGPGAVGRQTPGTTRGPSGRQRFDLGPGVADLRHLPRQAWARSAHTAVMTATPADLLGSDPLGSSVLRATLAGRLTVSRAVVADPDDVVVTHGSSDGVARVARALVASGHRALLVEDPGWPVLRDVARNAGLEPVPVPVDADGVDTHALVALAGRTGARAALVTPAHQFPSGGVLAPARREALVRWARDVDGVVLEDDYDAEFRYDRRPVAALQGLAPDRVVLVGSLSKTLAPAFGLGWLVGPRWLVGGGAHGAVAERRGGARLGGGAHGAVAERRGGATRGGGVGAGPSAGLDRSVPPPPVLHQLAFSTLVADGAYDRHLRAARTRYRRRRAALLEALATALPELPVSGVAAGLHAVLALPPGADEGRVVRLAAQRQVHVVPAGRYHAVPDGRPPALVLGYGNLVDAMLPEAVARLADAIRAEERVR